MEEGRRRPLSGIRIIDASALGPGPFASMVLAAHGADVIRVERPGAVQFDTTYLDRGKRSIEVNLKTEAGRDILKRLAAGADVFLESYRPGVMERQGLGPAELRDGNDRLIYVRLTGWGQSGPYASAAGHDINYISVTGALGAIGTDRPSPPLALVGDFAGGGLFAVIGTLLALRERETSGQGTVVDAAIVDGVSTLMWSTLARALRGEVGPRGTNLTDGGAPFYRTYRCADGRYFAVGAVEPQFYAKFLRLLGIEDEPLEWQHDVGRWPQFAARLEAVFQTRTRDDWTALFAGEDGCGTPVLDIMEVFSNEHLRARGTVAGPAGGREIRPAPRIGALDEEPRAIPRKGEHTRSVLAELGFNDAEIGRLEASGAVGAFTS